jgi:DNA primase
MRYPPQFLDRLRQHYRLSEVIGQRITLKRSGREYSGLCPFHNEKSPSFTVNDEKAFYHCFGCGAHGDVIGFLKEYENLSYPQAVESLARQAGITLPQPTREQKQQIDRAERLYQVMDAAAHWFTLQLRLAGGSEARDYLARRGLSDETVKEFRLGYGPQKRTALKDALMQRGFSEAELREVGLLATLEEGGNSFDKFRGRLMFPIHDGGGRVIAFGGRLIDPEAKGPKYLNSPDTPLFKKSYNLYHLDVARRAAAKSGSLLVVEGYMDVIALAQAGFPQAVAPLGTAITQEQLGMLWGIVSEPLLCLDGDAAGWRAMERALDLALPLLQPGKSLAFVRLPQGEDPDSLVQKHGKAALETLLAQKMPLIDVFWEKYYGQRPHQTPEQQAGTEQALKIAVDRIHHPSVRSHYHQAIKERLWNARRVTATRGKGKPADPQAKTALLQSRVALMPAAAQQRHGREEAFLTLMLLFSHYPALWDGAWEEALAEAAFGTAGHAAMRDALLHAAQEDAMTSRETLQAHLAAALGAGAWRGFLKETAHTLPKSLLKTGEAEGLPVAQQQLDHVTRRLELMALEETYAEVHARFTQTLDPILMERLDALRVRIGEMKFTQGYFPEEGTP